MKPLPYTAPHMEGETAASLASRVAAANGIENVSLFWRDMRLSHVGLRSGEPGQLERLATLAGADVDLLTKSTILSDRPNFSIGGQHILRIYLIRPRFRVCPRCLVDDIEGGSGPVASRAWFRAPWSVSLVRTCSRHNVLLEEIDPAVPARLAEDVSLIVRQSIGKIRARADAAETLPPSGLETWAKEKLAGKDGQSEYLRSLSFCTAMRLVEMIGASVIHGKTFAPSKLSDRDWFEAGQAGYPIVAAGERSILDHLSGFHANFARSTRGVGGRLLYGTLYPWLNFVTGDDFERIRTMIREHVIESFPVGPGDRFLGDIDRRRWHSVQTAATQQGMHPLRLRRLLRESGILGPETDGLRDHRVIIDAAEADAFLDQIKDTVLTRGAEKYLGMNRVQWASVVKAGFVKPIVATGRVHATYARRDLDAFLSTVAYSTGAGNPSHMVPVAKALKLATCSLLAIVQLLQGRVLNDVALDGSKHGFAAILVNPEEVKTALPRPRLSGLSAWEVAKRINVQGRTAARLIARGYIRHTVETEFSNRSGRRAVALKAADDFASEYVSLPLAAEKLGAKSAKALKAQLDGKGITPAIERAEVGGYFYRRMVIDALL